MRRKYCITWRYVVNLINRYETVYFEAKILHNMEVYGALSHKMDELILRNIKWIEPRLLILYFTYIYIYFLPYFHQNKMIKLLGLLLQCIDKKFV